jgi:HD-like signal output (HDOD) protein
MLGFAWFFGIRDTPVTAERPEPRRIADADILAAARQLPVAGGMGLAAPRILAALSAPTTATGDVLELVKQDPGITARVLRVANSALYGVRGGVATLRHAVQLLGFEAVRGIAAAACFNRTSAHSHTGASIDPEEIHAHCIATALAAEALAKATDGALAGEAFIAGLLHDFGVLPRLAMLSAPTRLTAPGADAADGDAALLADIAAAHEHYGAVVLESWGLPESLRVATRHHHEPAAAPAAHATLTALVHIADCMSRSLGFGFATDRGPCEAVPQATALVGLEADGSAAILAALPERVAALRAALAD